VEYDTTKNIKQLNKQLAKNPYPTLFTMLKLILKYQFCPNMKIFSKENQTSRRGFKASEHSHIPWGLSYHTYELDDGDTECK
jgi:hypothetical protein